MSGYCGAGYIHLIDGNDDKPLWMVCYEYANHTYACHFVPEDEYPDNEDNIDDPHRYEY